MNLGELAANAHMSDPPPAIHLYPENMSTDEHNKPHDQDMWNDNEPHVTANTECGHTTELDEASSKWTRQPATEPNPPTSSE